MKNTCEKPTLTALSFKYDAFIDQCAGILENRTLKLYPGPTGSVLFATLGILILVLIPSQIKVRADQTINARTFPAILAWIMLVCSAFNMINDGIRVIRRQKLPFIEMNLLNEVKAMIILLFLVIYALLMPLAGFSIASVVFALLMLLYFRVKEWKYYLLVTVLALGIGFLFKNVLNVRLP